MPRNYRLYLEDILEAIEKIERYLEACLSKSSAETLCG